MRQLLILIFASLIFGSVQAEFYHWVDKEGNVQLTETPPSPDAQAEGTTVETIEVSAPPEEVEGATDSETADNETTDAEPEASDAEAGEEGATPAEGEAQTPAEKVLAEKRRNCEVAQGRMKTLTSKAAILKKDEAGKDTLMSDEMRQSAIAETQEYVNMYCGSGEATE